MLPAANLVQNGSGHSQLRGQIGCIPNNSGVVQSVALQTLDLAILVRVQAPEPSPVDGLRNNSLTMHKQAQRLL